MNPKSEPLPDTTAENLKWVCWCSHVDVYANRAAHLELHKREKKAQK